MENSKQYTSLPALLRLVLLLVQLGGRDGQHGPHLGDGSCLLRRAARQRHPQRPHGGVRPPRPQRRARRAVRLVRDPRVVAGRRRGRGRGRAPLTLTLLGRGLQLRGGGGGGGGVEEGAGAGVLGGGDGRVDLRHERLGRRREAADRVERAPPSPPAAAAA